jgi:hypothetical protein
MKTKDGAFLRIRSNSNGLQVFFGGKWLPVDQQIAENIDNMLKKVFKRQAPKGWDHVEA